MNHDRVVIQCARKDQGKNSPHQLTVVIAVVTGHVQDGEVS